MYSCRRLSFGTAARVLRAQQPSKSAFLSLYFLTTLLLHPFLLPPSTLDFLFVCFSTRFPSVSSCPFIPSIFTVLFHFLPVSQAGDVRAAVSRSWAPGDRVLPAGARVRRGVSAVASSCGGAERPQAAAAPGTQSRPPPRHTVSARNVHTSALQTTACGHVATLRPRRTDPIGPAGPGGVVGRREEASELGEAGGVCGGGDSSVAGAGGAAKPEGLVASHRRSHARQHVQARTRNWDTAASGP